MVKETVSHFLLQSAMPWRLRTITMKAHPPKYIYIYIYDFLRHFQIGCVIMMNEAVSPVLLQPTISWHLTTTTVKEHLQIYITSLLIFSFGVSHDGEGSSKSCPATVSCAMAPQNHHNEGTSSNIYHFSAYFQFWCES